MYLKQVFIVITSSVLVACASTTDGPDSGNSGDSSRRDDCIFESSIRGYSVLDEANLIVSASNRRHYHVVLARRAWGLQSSWGIGFDSATSRICAGFSRVVFDGQFDRNDSINIRSIRRLDDEQHEALLIEWGKKEPEIKQGPVPQDVEGAEVEELGSAADDESGN